MNDAPAVSDLHSSKTENTSLDITVRGTVVEVSYLTYSIVDHPSNGTLSLNERHVKFTPNYNYNGPHTFPYKVNDGTD